MKKQSIIAFIFIFIATLVVAFLIFLSFSSSVERDFDDYNSEFQESSKSLSSLLGDSLDLLEENSFKLFAGKSFFSDANSLEKKLTVQCENLDDVEKKFNMFGRRGFLLSSLQRDQLVISQESLQGQLNLCSSLTLRLERVQSVGKGLDSWNSFYDSTLLAQKHLLKLKQEMVASTFSEQPLSCMNAIDEERRTLITKQDDFSTFVASKELSVEMFFALNDYVQQFSSVFDAYDELAALCAEGEYNSAVRDEEFDQLLLEQVQYTSDKLEFVLEHASDLYLQDGEIADGGYEELFVWYGRPSRGGYALKTVAELKAMQ